MMHRKDVQDTSDGCPGLPAQALLENKSGTKSATEQVCRRAPPLIPASANFYRQVHYSPRQSGTVGTVDECGRRLQGPVWARWHRSPSEALLITARFLVGAALPTSATGADSRGAGEERAAGAGRVRGGGRAGRGACPRRAAAPPPVRAARSPPPHAAAARCPAPTRALRATASSSSIRSGGSHLTGQH
ncbi:unnamed protein product, partial [Iphiclides podalirius]